MMWHGRLAHEVRYSAPIDGTPSIQAIAQAKELTQMNADQRR